MHEVLVNRLGGLSLPRKSVVRLTDRPDMTLDVYRGRKTTIQQYNIFFQIIGKKNNQSSVSGADRESPTLGSTDNAGNSVNLVSSIIRLPSGWDSLVYIGDR